MLRRQTIRCSMLLGVVREQHRDLVRLNAALQVLVRTPANIGPELNGSCLIRITRSALCGAALGDRGDARAIAPLMAVLSDPDSNVRMNAVEALGKLRRRAAVDALIGFVDSLDFELAFPAIDALSAIGTSELRTACCLCCGIRYSRSSRSRRSLLSGTRKSFGRC